MRALCSVWDKSGIEQFAAGLVGLGWEIVASGRTSAAFSDAGIEHLNVEDVTGWPEMLHGRVKTLHPAIHAGILADRSRPEHMVDLASHGVVPIDMVVCNLYPFASRPGVELIDVGGPTMVRAAAKNFAHVGAVVSPGQYDGILEELSENGVLSDTTRRSLARAAFDHTAAYDRAIVDWLDGLAGESSEAATGEPTAGAGTGSAEAVAAGAPVAPGGGTALEAPLPERITVRLEHAAALRYGENPHQRAAAYRLDGGGGWWDGVTQLGGVALSYLNLFDAEAAWQLAHELSAPGSVVAVVVKHANPCGVALAADAATACVDAIACDPVSAFGGIVAVNSVVTEEAASALADGPQLDVVVALGYEGDAAQMLAQRRRNTRILAAAPPRRPELELRALDGGFLVQRPDRISSPEGWNVAGAVQPEESQWEDLRLAWTVCARTSSNAIVIASSGRAVGIGAGQQNRVDSARIAAAKAGPRAAGGVAASDAFFPFPDGVEALADAGVVAVVQPGGSVRDALVTEAADRRGVAMVHTGERHFRH
ncbi:MAG: bifunctional phosphoribosylaminoimidazolecarboxamide formyltransferase/IMP cyclohydrolase [Actinomycetota bacterium]|nr:bifunctional phosphoribosylaminoimidazolecarboxamide formyltransferase/IMP cyclohydrolase [Actinomycetota bacterium]